MDQLDFSKLRVYLRYKKLIFQLNGIIIFLKIDIGILKTMLGKREATADVIPVDTVIK